MDILNWLSIKRQQLIKTTPNDAKADLLVLGAEVPFTQRGDGYQTYAMPLADAVNAVVNDNNTYNTPIYTEFPYIITPSMIKGSTTITDPNFGTLVTYKIAGAVDIQGSNPIDSLYLGTIEMISGFYFGEYKLTGNVTFYDGATYFNSALANGADVKDDDTNLPIAADVMQIVVDTPSPVERDLYLNWSSAAAVTISATVIFELEILVFENAELTFTVY